MSENNLSLYEKVRCVPESAKKTIQAGRTKGFTDINPIWRIKTLTEQFGPCGIGWYFEVTDKHIVDRGDESAAFVDINLYIKVDGEWSKPIYGTGGSRFATKEKLGVYVSDECYKMATTDALSVACKHLGIGADVYFSADCTKYTLKDQRNDAANVHQKKSNESETLKDQRNDAAIVHQKKSNEPEKIGQDHINAIYAELNRTGVDERLILQRYRINSLQDMTIECFDKCIKALNSSHDYIPPAPVPDESNDKLPFA